LKYISSANEGDALATAAGAAIGVIIFLIAFILVIPYTIYALRKWFE
jgi:ABC-type multidrug transport system permease subunit